ncbi:MAG: TonB-dependent receptor, partial [Bacteroidota bacterium]
RQTSGITLTYRPEKLDLAVKVLLKGDEQTVGDYLRIILQNQAVRIRPKRGKILLIPARQAQQLTLSGTIREKDSEEALGNATIWVRELNSGIYSNEHGFFSISLPPGKYHIRFSYLGHTEKWLILTLAKDQFTPIELVSDFILEQVELTAEEQATSLADHGQQSLHSGQQDALPALLGQKDVINQLQMLPGVQSMNEGISGLVVRGGSADQNLVLLDGIPVYNPSHSLGLFSIFHESAIQKTTLIKGAFPANYGGRLSSVIDVKMKEGRKDGFHGELSLRLLSGTLSVEGPLLKGKSSFHLSMRRTLLELFQPIQKHLFQSDIIHFQARYRFQDYALRFNHQFSPSTQLFASAYLGDDRLKLDQFFYGSTQSDLSEPDIFNFLKWGNQLFALRLNHIIGPKWFLHANAHYSSYRYRFRESLSNDLFVFNRDTADSDFTNFFSDSRIQDVRISLGLDHYPARAHHLSMGVSFTHHLYSPQPIFSNRSAHMQPDQSFSPFQKIAANELSGYLQNEWTVNPNLQLRAGLRGTSFFTDQGSYTILQPRFSVGWQFNQKHQFGASVSRMAQFSHLLSRPGLGLPSDLWVPSTKQIRPEVAFHLNLSYRAALSQTLRLSITPYFRSMENLLSYQAGVSFINRNPEEEWEKLVEVGKGRAYGIETQLTRHQGKLRGSLAYTLGWSQRQFSGINKGQFFPFRFDRRHDVNLGLVYQPNHRREFGLNWLYATGQAITIGRYQFNGLQSPVPIIPLDAFNGDRAPAYHRLDISASFHKQTRLGLRSWTFGIYNLYNRQNPFDLRFQVGPNGQPQLYQQSL